MRRWRDALVEPFVRELSHVTVVADPDGLLLDAEVQRRLTERGFECVTYADPIAFRLRYETEWREPPEGAGARELLVRVDDATLDILPYDVLARARRVDVDRARLFPSVSPRAMVWMDAAGLDWLDTRPTREAILDADRRAQKLLALLPELERTLPVGDAGWERWASYAATWAESRALRFASTDAPVPAKLRYDELHVRIEALFEAWMFRQYAGLHSLALDTPVMVHHVPKALARWIESGAERRAALVVLDGMAFEQWFTLRKTLDLAEFDVTESTTGVFAWVPTTTSVSRQALFAGAPPVRFAAQLGGTASERGLWEACWRARGLPEHAVGYVRGLGEGASAALNELLADPRIRALGLVVDKIDRIMHGMELGAAGMHDQVRAWGATRWLSELLRRLLAEGYAVYVTADHGNAELVGIGRIGDGALADVRGERVRVFSNDTLRQKVAQRVPSARCWIGAGLPAEYLALLATGLDAFVEAGQRLVGHGGIALEEVIVPLVSFLPVSTTR